MATAELGYLRTELEHRQERLTTALRANSGNASLSSLLEEVDAALGRMDEGTYGICKGCHTPIEADRLIANPLEQFCLDDLSSTERRALESDLALAAQIQRGLLPKPDVSQSGWRIRYHYAPAGLVSGDYCDIFESRGRIFFLLGDVSGKGVAASMLMSHLHATFRSLADADLPLDQLVEAANRIFAESTLAGQFATLVVGRAWPDGAVELVSAGHLPILHVGETQIRSQSATGLPLGMFKTTSFGVQKIGLRPTESLLMYTDGLSEARNEAGEEYGIARVEQVASERKCKSPEDLIEGCLSGVAQFLGASRRTDDLTLLAIHRAA